MSAYVIVETQVTDPTRYEAYRALSPAAVEAAGGRFVVRGGRCETLEGDWHPSRVVVLEFPTYAQARAFYDSPLYAEAREARAGATRIFNMIVVEGVQ
ncbi:MAG: DUF1330 domain-containing protein [Burkholderiaceae bacterium]